MRTIRFITIGGTLMLGLAACQDRTDDTPVPERAPATAEPVAGPARQAAGPSAGNLTVVNGRAPGPYLADDAGSALYALEGDRAGSGCVGACLEAWPPVLAGDSQPGVGAGLQANMASSIRRPDGTHQVTFNNHPLYRYSGDQGAGRTAGHGVEDQWGKWHLLSPQGEPIAADKR